LHFALLKLFQLSLQQLFFIEIGVDAAFRNKFIVCSAFTDPALVEDNDQVSLFDRDRKSVV
jgi:hypothetical protein